MRCTESIETTRIRTANNAHEIATANGLVWKAVLETPIDRKIIEKIGLIRIAPIIPPTS